jgi:cell wall-associated NlpC family hydrolase
MKRIIIYGGLVFLLYSCEQTEGQKSEVVTAMKIDSAAAYDSTKIDSVRVDGTEAISIENSDTLRTTTSAEIDTKNTHPNELVSFAETLIGVPYRYGSIDPKLGFDCSGFITYVFNHFNIKVPRSSIDFTDVGKEIPQTRAKRGDIILFTGTDSTEHFVGHMGIVVSNTYSLIFIHSTSGKAYGVTITPLNKYYQGRFVKTIRVFKQNDS